jgi:hypothetical protein
MNEFELYLHGFNKTIAEGRQWLEDLGVITDEMDALEIQQWLATYRDVSEL